jgi:HipA-like kinase
LSAFHPEIRQVQVIRYITPLREGGSLPAIAEADDGFLYVIKFRGAGQGSKSLIAELIGGEIARALGLNVPEIVFAQLDSSFGRTEPDEEIQDLLKASVGMNLGLHYLSGAISFDPIVTPVNLRLASEIVWLDCFLTNVDRTSNNTNMLVWNTELWLIDHGASLYFHYSPENWEQKAESPFPQVKNHVLLPYADLLEETDELFRSTLTSKKLKAIVDLIPDEWIDKEGPPPAEVRDIYWRFLQIRLGASEIFIKEAQNARAALV